MSNVVITGSTRGIGLGYAKKFLELGDSVVISSRNQERLNYVVEQLSKKYAGKVFGTTVDVTDFESIRNLGTFAQEKLGNIDYWINNAGVADKYYGPFANTSPETMKNITHTNVTGLLYGVKVALDIMLEQGDGHILNMGGKGTRGDESSNSLIYGFSKAGYKQLMASLAKEIKGTGIGVNTIMPGMVVTNLLIDREITPQNARVFNILAELPSTSASIIVPKIKSLKSGQSGKLFSVLTPMGAMVRFFTFWRYKNKFYDNATQEQLFTHEDEIF